MIGELVNDNSQVPLPWSAETEKLFEQDLTKDFKIDIWHIDAKVIADGINTVNNQRLVTVQIKVPRYILSEHNTHRMFSRNFASSRAIPAKKIRANVLEHMFVPVYWGANKSGMSADQQLEGWRLSVVRGLWKAAGYAMVGVHWGLEKLGLHKQTCNRLLEPWSSVYGVVTASQWDNFMRLRYSKFAQPEIICLAKAIHDAIKNSTPRKLGPTDYHLPYITEQEVQQRSVIDCIKTSVARCCRVSYKSNETGKLSDFDKDVALFDRLLKDHHMSPFEHVAFVPNQGRVTKELHIDLQRNFRGWYQFRAFVDPADNQKYLEKFYNIKLNG